MSSSIDYITCPKCGSTGAYREQDNRTCEITYGCPNCNWHGETVEKEDRVKPRPKKSRKKGLTFTCPECGKHRLECVMDGIHSCDVTSIPESGNFEYGDLESEADVDRWQCLECGYILQTKNGDNITANEDVVAWIKKNCNTKKKRGE
jgi:predicted RNA-binding Zn-ribbon protein involved in translation (DUF1610 family)/rubredoxin